MQGNNELLRLPPPCTVDPNDPWSGDLGRRQFGTNLTRLLTGARTPLVVSIEGTWGTGKSTFIRRWTTDLRAHGARAVVLNAWAASTFDTPRIALFGELTTVVREVTKTECPDVARSDELVAGVEAITSTFKEVMKSSLDVLTKGIVNTAVQEAATDAIDALRGQARLIPHAIDESITSYEAHKECYGRFTQMLGQIAHELRGSSDIPLVFVIDELDRCRPDFALEMLECLRHLFAAENIAFVLSIDADQVENSLRRVYGMQLDTDRYLRRIIDVRLPLPRPKARDLAVAAVRASRLDDVIRNRWDDQVTSDLIGYTTRLIVAYELDIRTTERLVSDFCTCAMVADSSIEPTNLINLLALRVRSREMFGLVEQCRDQERVFEFLSCASRDSQIVVAEHFQYFLADLYKHMLSPSEFAEKFAELKLIEGTAGEDPARRYSPLIDRMGIYNRSRTAVVSSPLSQYIDLINMNVSFLDRRPQ